MASRAALERQLRDLQGQVRDLRTEMTEKDRVQSAALQRLTFLPQGLQQLLAAEHCSTGTMTGDGQGMTYQIGGLVDLTIFPFADRFELRDSTGKMHPLRATFGRDADFSPEQVLQIMGFVALAQRDDLIANAGYWSQTINGLVASAG